MTEHAANETRAEIAPQSAPQSQNITYNQAQHGLAAADVADPGYREALKNITPDLSKLTNARTTAQQRETIYTANVADYQYSRQNNPEFQNNPELNKHDAALAATLDAARARGGVDAKTYQPRDNGKYTGQIVEVNEHYVLQQLRDSNSFIVHPIHKLNGQQLKAGDRHLMEYKDGALTVRDPERAQSRSAPEQQADKSRQSQERAQDQPKTFSELVQLKNEHAGKDAKLVMAKDAAGTAYTGTIIAETGDKVLQRVSDKYVVVHEKSNLARDVEVGSRKTLAYEDGRIDVLEPSQDHNRSRVQEANRAGERAPDNKAINKAMTPEQERRESFFQARGIIMSQFGSQSKVRDAKTDIGDYKGAIVAITKDHVAQQLGANSFVVHEKNRLAGSYHKGTHVAIKYNNGRAISSLTQMQREQTRGLSKGRDFSR